jgi:hypothetical protein
MMQMPDASDFDRWSQTVDEVNSILVEYPDRADNIWLQGFPTGSCSVASFAVAATLRQRYQEIWTIEWCFTSDHSHTWLSRDIGTPFHVSIDATLQQFSELAREPFIGPGPSPVIAAMFGGSAISAVLADQVPEYWHHGSTREIYEYAFPRLGFTVAEAGLE